MKNATIQILLPLLTFILLFVSTQQATAQVEEPPIREGERIATNLNDNYRAGIGFDVLVSNFGLGLGGEYRRVLGSQTEGYAVLRFNNLRDVTEQTFTDIFFGQQIVPNKFQRAFSFPVMLGFRQRLFGDVVQDNYRFFISAGAGPVAAFSFPYFDDRNDNGYREQFQNYFEPVNDIFTGWSEGEWHWGAAGEIKFGMDVGRNFASVTSIEFGYFFNYYPNGIQMMMPKQPDLREGPGRIEERFQFDEDGELLLEPFFDAQRWFGTPQITLTFGRLW